MNLTINTDASFVDTYKAGGFAFWIVTDQGKIQKAGELKNEVHHSNECELQSICNALHTLKHSKFNGITKVYINTDSKCAIDFIAGKSHIKNEPVKKTLKEIHFLMMEICLKYGFTIRDFDSVFIFKHVKAHNGKKDSRSFVNDWCDKQAKFYCKQLITKIKNGVKR